MSQAANLSAMMSGTTLTVPNLTYTGTLTGVSQNLSGNLTANNIGSSNNVTYSGTLTGGTGVIAIGTNQIYKDASGNVGIGTATPSYKLHVATGSLTLNGADNSVVTLRSGASTYLNVLQSYTSTFLGTKIVSTDALSFGTSNTDRLFIDISGNLGIGTSSPGYKLDIQSAVSGYAANFQYQVGAGDCGVRIVGERSGNDGAVAYLDLCNFNYSTPATYVMGRLSSGMDGGVGAGASNGNLKFSTSLSGTLYERMRLDSSGNLLIGTTTVLAKLTVNGNIISPWDSGASYFGALCYSTANAGTFINHNNGVGISFIQVNHTAADPGGNYYQVFTRAGTAVGQILSVGTTNVSYITSSDQRLKTDLGQAVSTSVIENTVVHDFEWKSDGSKSRGVFAQEAYEVNPGAVGRGQSDELNEDGFPIHPWGVDYSKYVPDLIVYCQQLNARLEALEAK